MTDNKFMFVIFASFLGAFLCLSCYVEIEKTLAKVKLKISLGDDLAMVKLKL